MIFLSIKRNRQSEIIIISLSNKKNQPMRIENSLNNIFFSISSNYSLAFSNSDFLLAFRKL